MVNICDYTIISGSTLLDALEKLDKQSSDFTLTLFVVDDQQKVLGSVTDGDIRRSLLKSKSIGVLVDEIMKTSFVSIEENDFNLNTLKAIKKRKLKIVPILDTHGAVVKLLNFATNTSYLPLDAVLMAGGKGERLRPMTETTPKPLLHVNGKPIIEYNIDNLLKNGIENINVTVNYLKEQVEDYFSSPCRNGVKVRCVSEPKFLGTIGSVKLVQKWYNDSILIMNSDLFTNIYLEDFFIHFKEHDADMSVATVPYSVNIPFGIFDIEDSRNITGIREKPSYNYHINAGIYLIKREIVDLIPDTDTQFNATDLIQLLINMNKKVIRYPISGYWIDIGNPDDFKKVQELAKHISRG